MSGDEFFYIEIFDDETGEKVATIVVNYAGDDVTNAADAYAEWYRENGREVSDAYWQFAPEEVSVGLCPCGAPERACRYPNCLTYP